MAFACSARADATGIVDEDGRAAARSSRAPFSAGVLQSNESLPFKLFLRSRSTSTYTHYTHDAAARNDRGGDLGGDGRAGANLAGSTALDDHHNEKATHQPQRPTAPTTMSKVVPPSAINCRRFAAASPCANTPPTAPQTVETRASRSIEEQSRRPRLFVAASASKRALSAAEAALAAADGSPPGVIIFNDSASSIVMRLCRVGEEPPLASVDAAGELPFVRSGCSTSASRTVFFLSFFGGGT